MSKHVSAHKGNEKASWLTDLGINVTEMSMPFFKPNGKKQIVKILDARPPTDDEANKKVMMNGREVHLPVLAVATVEINGVEHEWEVTGKRALAALASIPGPGHYRVYTLGSGTAQTTIIEATNGKTRLDDKPARKDGNPEFVKPDVFTQEGGQEGLVVS